MLNTEHFILLAGDPSLWDKEIKARVDNGDALVDVQVDQHRRGRQSAMLVHGAHGWYVRAASNLFLTDTPIICNTNLTGGKLRHAVSCGIVWANGDPSKREFFVRKQDITPDIQDMLPRETVT